MTIIDIIVFACLFRLLGNSGRIKICTRWLEWDYTIERRAWIIAFAAAYILLLLWDWKLTAAYMLVFMVARTLPTSPLFSALHGKAPTREDGRWQFLQDWTFWIWKKIPDPSFFTWGIIYGMVRMCLAIPAMLYIGNPWMFSLLGIGIIYYIAGRVATMLKQGAKAAMYAESATGALFGLMI